MSAPRIIAIGTSTGGVVPLRRLLAGLRPDFSAVILVVQHVSHDRPSNLAQILAKAGPLRACAAVDGESIESGRIYVAPPDSHLLVQGQTLRLDRDSAGYRCRPAIDPLFLSIASEPERARQAIGIVLSGGDADGAQGLAAIKAAGGTTVVQTPSDALSPIMPNKAIALHAPDYCLPADAIGALLNRLICGADRRISRPRLPALTYELPPDPAPDTLRVLVAEDLYPIAAEIGEMLLCLGHQPLGPAGSVAAGLALLERGAPTGTPTPIPDAAVLDIDLRGEPVYALAAALRSRGVPIVFATGYAARAIPAEWRNVPHIEKPFTAEDLGEMLDRARAASLSSDGCAEGAGSVQSGAAPDDNPSAATHPDAGPSEVVHSAWNAIKNMRNMRMVFGMGNSTRRAPSRDKS